MRKQQSACMIGNDCCYRDQCKNCVIGCLLSEKALDQIDKMDMTTSGIGTILNLPIVAEELGWVENSEHSSNELDFLLTCQTRLHDEFSNEYSDGFDAETFEDNVKGIARLFDLVAPPIEVK